MKTSGELVQDETVQYNLPVKWQIIVFTLDCFLELNKQDVNCYLLSSRVSGFLYLWTEPNQLLCLSLFSTMYCVLLHWRIVSFIHFHYNIAFLFAQYMLWTLLWVGWNVFVSCLYLDLGGLSKVSLMITLVSDNWIPPQLQPLNTVFFLCHRLLSGPVSNYRHMITHLYSMFVISVTKYVISGRDISIYEPIFGGGNIELAYFWWTYLVLSSDYL